MASEKKEITLTKAEEQVMQVLWKLKKAFVKDILKELPQPKPAYNTVSTIIRILEQKNIVSYEAFGRSHRYFPLIDKETYTARQTERLLKNHFGNSVESLLSFFVDKKKLDLRELDDILKNIKRQKS